MSRYFAIHGIMRTGSNLLEQSLAALGDTVCYGEAFNPGFTGGPRRTDILGWTVADRDADPFGFLRALCEGAGGRIAGFRIFDGHDRAIAAHTLADPDCARIVLRRDPLHAWVSLRIARETGQWMLRNPRRRQTAMVRFDPEAFEAWRAGVEAHYAWIEAEMARAGTAALWLDYEALTDPATIAAAARHVGSAGRVPEAAPIVRQNPERLVEKVENYDALCAWLGRCPDPPAEPSLPGPGEVLLSRHLALGCVPVPGPALAPALALMQRLEAQAGAAAVAPVRLAARPARHFRAGLNAAALAREAAGRHVFALVCHPVERLHGLFLAALFGSDRHGAAVRRAIVARTGPVPGVRAARRGGATFPEGLHRAAFDAYLDLVAEAGAGRGPLADAPARLSQTGILEAHRAWVRLDSVGRLEAFAGLAATLATTAGQRKLPAGQVAGLARAGAIEALPLARILDGALAGRVLSLHGPDYDAFGYDELPDA